MWLANETTKAVDHSIKSDQGDAFRVKLGEVLPTIDDAYRKNAGPWRPHLGASQIGGDCSRALWYGFRWAVKPNLDAQLLRLFNRGHLEEGRFVAMLSIAGIKVWQQDDSGRQFRINGCWGHFGGSGDGVALGVPDLPIGTYCLLEFKTVNDKGFKDMVANGVEFSKPVYFTQMQIYMEKMGLRYGLFGMVNKNDDNIHWEIVEYRPGIGKLMEAKAQDIIFSAPDRLPAKMAQSPTFYKCKWCSYQNICHYDEKPAVNCRTCVHAEPVGDDEIPGRWLCHKRQIDISVDLQYTGCEQYERGF